MLVPYIGEDGSLIVAVFLVAGGLGAVAAFCHWLDKPKRDLIKEIKKRPTMIVDINGRPQDVALCFVCVAAARRHGMEYVWLYPDGHILGMSETVPGSFVPPPMTFCGKGITGSSKSYRLPRPSIEVGA